MKALEPMKALINSGPAKALVVWILMGSGHGPMLGSDGWRLEWWTIDAGGGRSQGAGYQLTATLGQPDAGTAVGAGYRLQGGFWPGPIQSVSLPPAVIGVMPVEGGLRLEWPASLGRVVVESQRELKPTEAWDTVEVTPEPVGDRLRVLLPISDGNGFFRLKRLP